MKKQPINGMKSFQQQLHALQRGLPKEEAINLPLKLYKKTCNGIFTVEYLRQNTGKSIDIDVHDWLMHGLDSPPDMIAKALGLTASKKGGVPALASYEVMSRNRFLLRSQQC